MPFLEVEWVARPLAQCFLPVVMPAKHFEIVQVVNILPRSNGCGLVAPGEKVVHFEAMFRRASPVTINQALATPTGPRKCEFSASLPIGRKGTTSINIRATLQAIPRMEVALQSRYGTRKSAPATELVFVWS